MILAAACVLAPIGMPVAAQDAGPGEVATTATAAATSAAVAERLAAPLRGFVYLEPYEIRSEFVLRLAAFPRFVPEAAGDDAAALDPAAQTAVLDAVAAALPEASRLTADGELARLARQTIRFIQFDPDGGPVLDERPAIPVAEAIVAAVYAGGRSGFPEELVLDWRLFPATAGVLVELEASAGPEIQGTTTTIEPGQPRFTWAVPAISMLPPPAAVAADVAGAGATPLIAAAAFGLVALAIGVRAIRRPAGERRGPVFVAVIIAGLGGAAAIGLSSGGGRMEREEGRAVVAAVLGNVYGAFAYRDESTIFDTLALSVEGPLLEELYLDIREGFEIEEAGGPRVKVLELTLIDCQVQGASGSRVRARAIWACTGNVSHWGHVHRRRNQYRGELTLEPVDGAWKLVDVTILDEQRI
jgi:hypothetical protein